MYIIKKGIEYFFPRIDKVLLEEALSILLPEERIIFLGMGKYDIFHSLEVYKKILEKDFENKEKYLKLALLHDCGKGRSSIFKRILHKVKIRTDLARHPMKGYEKLKNLDNELAILIRNHHKENYSKEMEIFRKCDDES